MHLIVKAGAGLSMAGKKNKLKRQTGVETFNKSQHIYKLLEKGIIESEALSGNSTDRPEQEDHIASLLGSIESEPAPQRQQSRRISISRKRPIRRSSAKPGIAKRKQKSKTKRKR